MRHAGKLSQRDAAESFCPVSSKFSLSSLLDLGPRYGLLFSAGLLSDIGGFSTHIALNAHIYQLSNQNVSYMGLAALASLVPWLLGSPLGGVWAESRNRRRVMIANDLFRMPLVLGMAMTNNIWAILGIQFCLSGSTAAFNPSRQSIIPEVVKPDQIHLANTVNGGILSVVHVLGPIIGAYIYAKSGSMVWIAILNAATYGISALLLFMLPYERMKTKEENSPKEHFLVNIREGFSYVSREKDLLIILFTLMTSGAAIGILIPLLRPFVSVALNGDDIIYGQIISAFGFGGVVGPLVGYWAGRRFGMGGTISIAFALEAIILIIWSQVTNIPLSYFLLFLWGVVVFTMIPCYMSYVHTYARKEFMGRSFALFDQGHIMAQLLGAGVIAYFGKSVPTQNLLTATGVVYLVIVVLITLTEGSRLLRSRSGIAETVTTEEHAQA